LIKLKNIKLINYCGYRDFELNLSEGEEVRKWTVLYGPNGSYKSTFLRAVDLLATPMLLERKSTALLLRKMKYHPDYAIVGAEAYFKDASNLKMEAIFLSNGQEKTVSIEDNLQGIINIGRRVDKDKGEKSGVQVNELSPTEQKTISINADSPMMMIKFQVIDDIADAFYDFASAVYGLKCYCPDKARVEDSGIEYRTDFVIEKNNGTKVHFKSMSDGEKKIATLVSSLFKIAYKDSPDRKENSGIVCIDNIAQHIYYKRHMSLINKMEEYFPENQFIITTHSPVIINEMDKKYLVNMEDY
jgi:AAA15 family ATPase/GTPase